MNYEHNKHYTNLYIYNNRQDTITDPIQTNTIKHGHNQRLLCLMLLITYRVCCVQYLSVGLSCVVSVIVPMLSDIGNDGQSKCQIQQILDIQSNRRNKPQTKQIVDIKNITSFSIELRRAKNDRLNNLKITFYKMFCS